MSERRRAFSPGTRRHRASKVTNNSPHPHPAAAAAAAARQMHGNARAAAFRGAGAGEDWAEGVRRGRVCVRAQGLRGGKHDSDS